MRSTSRETVDRRRQVRKYLSRNQLREFDISGGSSHLLDADFNYSDSYERLASITTSRRRRPPEYFQIMEANLRAKQNQWNLRFSMTCRSN